MAHTNTPYGVYLHQSQGENNVRNDLSAHWPHFSKRRSNE